ncbi:MobF family relaxase [Pseudoduganella aquatica]|uniref:Relaxase domain-containing protein n=1 Tax=Pseudoduganella aquatica TaxID=2660641 RepID=A0A7X4HIR6_9BURK|nr:MobF family relaxase [Pseudoduganella aquatica]MYN11237.1 relaxase domain-containing protein [Pseudoduganella aquatica]
MLSITKINSASNQPRQGQGGAGYLHYLGGPSNSTRQRGDFDDYARGREAQTGPLPFWTCKGAALLGLDGAAEAEQVERLAKGFHPITGLPLVKGAGDQHVMGLDMTFSAPKDVSALFAGANASTREEIARCVQDAAKSALAYAETNTVTRHGHAGKIKRFAEAAIAAGYQHFSSRAGEPQLHVHGFLFNLGKRQGADEWSALEQRGQFDRKKATGILFRVELASRLKALGFAVEPAGPYFTIKGVTQSQRDALSTRSKQIAEYLRECGAVSAHGALAREIAALNTRSAKAEPSLPELLSNFERMAACIGLTPATVAAMRSPAAPRTEAEEPIEVDHDAILAALMESQSCAAAHEALELICEHAMGRLDAAECLAELDRFMQSAEVIKLGETEQLAEIFTSKATLDLEARISAAVATSAQDRAHHLPSSAIDASFDRLEEELRKQLGVDVSLGQQRAAALHIACETGACALVEGWAGAGKTTMLKALGETYMEAGFEVLGCCQSAAASQNLARETGIKSRTIASLLHSLGKGRAKLTSKSILVLDEAGMVGSREFGLLQEAVRAAGGKLVAVGDPKQLQPIDAGGIFRALIERHGKAEISNIQRQRTDFEPLLNWLSERGSISKARARALHGVPESARLQAIEALCVADAKLGRAFDRWRARFDFEWLREAVELFATGEAKAALQMLDERGKLKLISGHTATVEALISDWSADKTPIERKTMIAGTRAEVAELNGKARALLIDKGLVRDTEGLEIEIVHRDETTDIKRFAPRDRIVFTKNDKTLGVTNGCAGTIRAIEQAAFTRLLRVELDDANELGERIVMIPPSFGHFDLGYCLTNHKSQGRTFDSAYTLANPSMCDREWTYVAASRSRFSTTLYSNQGVLQAVDLEGHQEQREKPTGREAAIDALALRMRRSRAKGTTLDYEDGPDIRRAAHDGTASLDALGDSRRKSAQGGNRLSGKETKSQARLSVSAAVRFLSSLAQHKSRQAGAERHR